MLIISHRGAAGLKPENSIAGLRAAIKHGADIVEFDVRLTKDKIPVLGHDFHTWRTHKKISLVSRMTLEELQKETAGSDNPIVTLEAALKECFGKIIINIEIKQRAAVEPILLIAKRYLKKKSDWDNIIFSSFKPTALSSIRSDAPHAHLAMLEWYNPIRFMVWHRKLRLSAVGFHRLYASKFALEVAKQLGLLTYAYTINRPAAAQKLAQRGVDAIVTDYPDKMAKTFS